MQDVYHQQYVLSMSARSFGFCIVSPCNFTVVLESCSIPCRPRFTWLLVWGLIVWCIQGLEVSWPAFKVFLFVFLDASVFLSVLGLWVQDYPYQTLEPQPKQNESDPQTAKDRSRLLSGVYMELQCRKSG